MCVEIWVRARRSREVLKGRGGCDHAHGSEGCADSGDVSVWGGKLRRGLGVRVGAGEQDLERFTGEYLRVFWGPDGVHQGYPRAHWRVCRLPGAFLAHYGSAGKLPVSACFCPCLALEPAPHVGEIRLLAACPLPA